MDFNLVFKFILAFLIGAVIGLEREVNEKKHLLEGSKKTAILGLRTFSLTAILGAITGMLSLNFPVISIILASAFLFLTIVFYTLDSFFSRDFGITTEIALIYSFVLGLLITLEVIPMQLTLAIAVVLIFLLSRKETIKNVMEDIKHTEVNAFVSFAIIALVILPFLPNFSYSLSDIPNFSNFIGNFGTDFNQIINLELINPFRLWMIVALITGVNLVGYTLEKTLGQKKGWVLASIAGGFISSTATTQSLAQKSNKSKGVNHLVSAAVISNLVSFIQIAIILGSFNIAFLIKLIPTLLAMISAAFAALVFFLTAKEENVSVIEKENIAPQKEIINLGSALKFAGLFVFISLVSKIALVVFGSNGFLVTTGLGAMVGLDAVMINTAQIAGNAIDFKLAILAFILANFVNLAAKVIYSFLQGKKEFAVKFSISMGVTILASLTGLFFS